MSWWIFNDYQSLFEILLVLFGLNLTAYAIYRNASSIKTNLLHDMTKEERDIQFKLRDIYNQIEELKRKNISNSKKKKQLEKQLRLEQKFLIEQHLNFFEHLSLLIHKHKINENDAKDYYKDLVITTVEAYRCIKKKEIQELLDRYVQLNRLYSRWKEEDNDHEHQVRSASKPKMIKYIGSHLFRIQIISIISIVILFYIWIFQRAAIGEISFINFFLIMTAILFCEFTMMIVEYYLHYKSKLPRVIRYLRMRKTPKLFEFIFFLTLFMATLAATFAAAGFYIEGQGIDVFYNYWWFSGLYGIAIACGYYHYILRIDD
ncbi:unnamed protein product [marine sediment metagenome]|uniref:Uncharacterized protein n=1 Tax=marine sediment metagenome TaxID=412755 RepID=X0SAU5_9ZZZZ